MNNTEPLITNMSANTPVIMMWYEEVAHLYNIQRLKRAQGLAAKVELPQEGYWTVPDWDRSEP